MVGMAATGKQCAPTHYVWDLDGDGTFETDGAVHSAITAVKSRTSQNQRTIREFRLTPGVGIEIGEPLAAFEGILGGVPAYTGETKMMSERPE